MATENPPGPRRHALRIVVLVLVVIVAALCFLRIRAWWRDFNAPAEVYAVRDLTAISVRLMRAAGERLVVTSSTPDQIRREFAETNGRVVASRIASDGVIQWDVIAVGSGSSRNAWTDDETLVRGCFQLAGRPGTSTSVTRRTIRCRGLANNQKRFGPWNSTTELPPAHLDVRAIPDATAPP